MNLEKCAEEFEYLENLRKSGVTNMWGAGSYLQDEFGYSKEDANLILIFWMNNYEELTNKYNW